MNQKICRQCSMKIEETKENNYITISLVNNEGLYFHIDCFEGVAGEEYCKEILYIGNFKVNNVAPQYIISKEDMYKYAKYIENWWGKYSQDIQTFITNLEGDLKTRIPCNILCHVYLQPETYFDQQYYKICYKLQGHTILYFHQLLPK